MPRKSDSSLFIKIMKADLKQRLALKEFGENASGTPHVNRCRVPLISNQQLGRSIPQRDDLVRVGSRVGRVADAGEAEIAEFDLATLCHQNVRAFQIAMEHIHLVAIAQSE